MTGRWSWHGGGLAAAKAHFGEGDRPWIDLSTGINPHAWPGAEDIAVDWRRLPENSALRALENAAARQFGADPALVCALPGTEIGMRLLGEMLPAPARFLTPCYRTHGDMADAKPLPFDRLDEDDGPTLILANPNNPDGRVIARPAMVDLITQRSAGNWLLVDEAFADTAPEISLASEVGEDRQLIVFRSFGKFFGLAGVRLGFILGPSALIEKIRTKLGAWPVSAAAIAIGEAAYSDRKWICAMRERLRAEGRAVDAMLAGIGFPTIGQCPLFRLIETDDAMSLFKRLAERQILTRPFTDHPRWIRIGLPKDAEDLKRLKEALVSD